MKYEDSPLGLFHQSIDKILFARSLRKNMTPEEAKVWEAVRRKALGCRWRKQVPLGQFVADFCCMKHRVIVEIDGKYHEETKEYDRNRDEHLSSMSHFRIIRIPNAEVRKNLEGVIKKMRNACGSSDSR